MPTLRMLVLQAAAAINPASAGVAVIDACSVVGSCEQQQRTVTPAYEMGT